MNYNINDKIVIAADKLSTVLISIWNDPRLRLYCENLLENLTKESNKKMTIHTSCCKEPWQIILWCYCSLNTKGSSKAAKEWTKIDRYNLMVELFHKFILSENKFSESQKFIAINCLLRYFAGGKFLTVRKDLIGDIYIEKSEVITTEFLEEKLMIVNDFDIEEYEKKAIKADAWYLFQLLKECQFDINEINNKFQNVSIIDGSENDLMKLKGVSKKYSRNIKMDLRTTDSENFIAIDSRLGRILKKLDLSSNVEKKYNEIEYFFNKHIIEDRISKVIVPSYSSRPKKLIGISSWELDRLIYNLGEEKLLEQLI